jgi:hypothetical protein
MGKGLQIVILLIVVIIGIIFPLFTDDVKNTGNVGNDEFGESAYDFISISFRFFFGIVIFIIGLILILLIQSAEKVAPQPQIQQFPPAQMQQMQQMQPQMQQMQPQMQQMQPQMQQPY